MAEVLLKVGAGSGYDDGDVLCAFNGRRIRCAHAGDLCHQKWAGFTSGGLRPDGLARDASELTYQYRFERRGVEVVRTTLATNAVEVFGHADIDVGAYLARRLKHARHRIFGKPGAEVWYGGDISATDSTLDLVWGRIAHHTDEREEGFRTLWPMGRQDIREHLALRTADFTDEEAEGLVEPLMDGDEIKSKRRLRVAWRDLLADVGESEADVLNPGKAVGRDVVLPKGRMRYESKAQKHQTGRDRLISKGSD